MINPIAWAENGRLPYWLIRFGIRKRLAKKLNYESSVAKEAQDSIVDVLSEKPIAEDTDKANEQHYELPPEFFKTVLGSHLKYSSSIWSPKCESLDQSEKDALELLSQRAQLADGQKVLDLGCGWGSFSLWAAQRFPGSQFVCVSNSKPQGDFIRGQIEEKGIRNLEVRTADMNSFNPGGTFDRIVSVEMFEHMRNYEHLLERISSWLHEDGLMFVHIFTHKDFAYTYNAEDESEWMAQYFFTGGVMPSHNLLAQFDKHLRVAGSWRLSGEHYQKTLDAWLEKFDENEESIREIFNECYGKKDTKTWMWRWRLFFLACSELFGYKRGSEWGVSHYVFRKQLQS
ncbi:cyclopropane-fatty-acyl-phospholipid synthase family protein [Opitutia bacterium ISCC 51]|nr:cyclopropane-fatty-acyl-phospholipid synthase family protein [Opitutae bacterium ISCC 51]QXD27677.1 cyclopropane-fatty-acyl-phospholipid synthase family protein [Opitutae bacterium ISCC 52]